MARRLDIDEVLDTMKKLTQTDNKENDSGTSENTKLSAVTDRVEIKTGVKTYKIPRKRFSGFLIKLDMGFDTERFTSPVNDALTCCICRDVLEDPVQAPCEHAYCRTCIEGWLVHETSCPEDRQPLCISDLRPLFRYMRNDLDRLQIHCRNRLDGCETVSDLEFIGRHERDCEYERLKCPNDRCTTYCSRRDLTGHIRTCDYSKEECSKGCGLLITRPSDHAHNCIQELRTAIEVLRSEMTCKYDEQKKEMDLRLDMQRGHMIQKEATLQSQIDALKSENSKLSQNMKLMMDMELERRQEFERLKLEKQELIELLREKSETSSLSRSSLSTGTTRRTQTTKGKVTTI